jgi:prolyl 4-hydroxylase
LGKQVPSAATILSPDPQIYMISDFLSEKECKEYIDRVENLESTKERDMTRSNPPEVSITVSKLWPLPFLSLAAGIPPLLKLGESPSMEQISLSVVPAVAVALTGSVLLALLTPTLIKLMSDSSSRTSDAMALNLKEDVDFIRPLVDRVCEATQHPWFAWESPVVTRYEPGAIFAQHGDASPIKGSEWSKLGGQRVVTCIVYLNTVMEGGETSFPKIGVAVRPKKGSALFFYPANVDTLDADDRTIHESLPPAEIKWIVQMFGRVGPRVPPPLGIPDSYDSS